MIPFMCIDGASFMHAQSGINVFTDLVLLVYPLPLLRVLKFNRRQRSTALSCDIGSFTLTLDSGAHRHLLHRPDPRGREHHAALRNRHERERNPDGHGVAADGFELVSSAQIAETMHVDRS